MLERVIETIFGQQVRIEVWAEGGGYNGYAFCPMEECVDACKEPFQARRKTHSNTAKNGARQAVKRHLTNVHGLSDED